MFRCLRGDLGNYNRERVSFLTAAHADVPANAGDVFGGSAYWDSWWTPWRSPGNVPWTRVECDTSRRVSGCPLLILSSSCLEMFASFGAAFVAP